MNRTHLFRFSRSSAIKAGSITLTNRSLTPRLSTFASTTSEFTPSATLDHIWVVVGRTTDICLRRTVSASFPHRNGLFLASGIWEKEYDWLVLIGGVSNSSSNGNRCSSRSSWSSRGIHSSSLVPPWHTLCTIPRNNTQVAFSNTAESH